MTLRQAGARWISLATAITASALAVPGTATAAQNDSDSPPSTPVTLEVQTVNGSGCPNGTASVTASPGNTGFKIRYNDFTARAGGSAGPTEFRRNCQVNLAVHIPQGFTVAVARADYVGRARLADGASAKMRSNYYYQADPDNTWAEHAPIDGPYLGSWHTIDATDETNLVYAPCGETRLLNINTELRVDAGTATGSTNTMSMRSSEGEVYTAVQFSWLHC